LEVALMVHQAGAGIETATLYAVDWTSEWIDGKSWRVLNNTGDLVKDVRVCTIDEVPPESLVEAALLAPGATLVMTLSDIVPDVFVTWTTLEGAPQGQVLAPDHKT
jgi:hypothetical protein